MTMLLIYLVICLTPTKLVCYLLVYYSSLSSLLFLNLIAREERPMQSFRLFRQITSLHFVSLVMTVATGRLLRLPLTQPYPKPRNDVSDGLRNEGKTTVF